MLVLSNRLSCYNPFIKPMMASGKKVAVRVTSSLAAHSQSYVLYNLETIKDGCKMLFSDLLFHHLRGHPCHSIRDLDKEAVIKQLNVKVGWY